MSEEGIQAAVKYAEQLDGYWDLQKRGPSEKKRCAHGVFKYGECAECREELREAEEDALMESEGRICSTHGFFTCSTCTECRENHPRLKKLYNEDGSKKDVRETEFALNAKEKHTLGDCLDEAKKTICGERQDVYGSPEDSFTLIANYWNSYLAAKDGMLSALDVAHMMILFKMARVQGQAPCRDNYVDIAGYASIAADRF